MAEEEKKVAIALPGEWALQKAFGPVLTEIGEDLKRLYAAGRDRILTIAVKKIANLDDGRRANLRVTRDVLWNGAFTDDEVCAEYFGGLLAASRSIDGKDDGAIPFVDVIKSLSAKQLHLHYATYNCLNKLLLQHKGGVNIGLGSELRQIKVWFASSELAEKLGLGIETDFTVLHRQGLVGDWRTEYVSLAHDGLYCSSVCPTTFGVLLYAAANNQLAAWESFDSQSLGDFENVLLPLAFASSCEALCAKEEVAPWVR